MADELQSLIKASSLLRWTTPTNAFTTKIRWTGVGPARRIRAEPGQTAASLGGVQLRLGSFGAGGSGTWWLWPCVEAQVIRQRFLLLFLNKWYLSIGGGFFQALWLRSLWVGHWAGDQWGQHEVDKLVGDIYGKGYDNAGLPEDVITAR